MASVTTDQVIEVDTSSVSSGIGCALDIGGSLGKGVYISEAEKKDSGKCQICLVTFPPSDLQDGLNHMRERCIAGKTDQAYGTIHTTGVAVRKQIKSTIETIFKAKVEVLPEFSCCIKGAKYLIKHVPRCTSLLPLDEECLKESMELGEGMQLLASKIGGVPVKSYEGWEKLGTGEDSSHLPLYQDIKYPYLLISAGTGCFFAVVEDGSHKVVDGTTRCGKFFMGLAQLLLGTDNYDEILSLAETGDDSQISNYMRDMKSNDEQDDYTLFPDDFQIFCFGKVLDEKQKLENCKREDLASALVSMIAMEISQLCFWVAKANNCNQVFMTGGLLKHPLMRRQLLLAFLPAVMFSSSDITLHFLQQGDHLSALGALLENAEHASKESTKEYLIMK